MSDKPSSRRIVLNVDDIGMSGLLNDYFDAILYDIRHCKKRTKEVLAYHDLYHSVLAHQRAQVLEDLKVALAQHTTSFKFQGWSRIVAYQHANHPLSASGSVYNDPGGRFNIGAIDPLRFPPFPALYVAKDFPTAFKEVYGQTTKVGNLQLTESELALANGASMAKVCICGYIEHVLNILDPSALKEFVDSIKGFKLSQDLYKRARTLKLHLPRIIKDVPTLQSVLLSHDWRNTPQLVDTPAPSQIFGQIAHAAGIEAILYQSVKTSKDCLAVFVENFENSTSYVELEGSIPPATTHSRLDSTTWKDFV